MGRGALTMVPHPCTRHKVPLSMPPGGDCSPQAKHSHRHTATTAEIPGTGALHRNSQRQHKTATVIDKARTGSNTSAM